MTNRLYIKLSIDNMCNGCTIYFQFTEKIRVYIVHKTNTYTLQFEDTIIQNVDDFGKKISRPKSKQHF